MASNIKVKFQTSSLSEAEDKLAETAGMLILASDFLGDKAVGKAEQIKRISKASIPLLFIKTKTGGYLALNPSSEREIRVPITNLIDIQELKAFLDNKANLTVDRVYKKLLQLKVTDTILKGGLSKKDLEIVYALLDTQRVQGNWDFKELPTTREQADLKADIDSVNSAIYDKKRLEAEIKKRIDLATAAFKAEVDQTKGLLEERTTYWKNRIKELELEEKAKLKEREKKLQADLTALKKEAEKSKKENLKTFVKGVAKNIRKDEKEIEKLVQELEKLTATPGDDPITAIDETLAALDDATDTFKAAISFAKDQVNRTRNREADIDADLKLESEDLERKAELDKEAIRRILIDAKAERQAELAEIEKQLQEAQSKYEQFLDRQDQLAREIERQVQTEGAPMIEPERFKLDNPGQTIKMLVPIYIFQYGKRNKNDLFTIAIPPVKVPDTLRKFDKNALFGKHKAIFYYPIHPRLSELVEWIPRTIETNLVFRNAVDALPNLVTKTQEMRDSFYQAKPLLVNTLHMAEKNFRKAAERLSGEVIA